MMSRRKTLRRGRKKRTNQSNAPLQNQQQNTSQNQPQSASKGQPQGRSQSASKRKPQNQQQGQPKRRTRRRPKREGREVRGALLAKLLFLLREWNKKRKEEEEAQEEPALDFWQRKEREYQRKQLTGIEAVTQRIREFLDGLTSRDTDILKGKWETILSGEPQEQPIVFWKHEQYLMPYLLPWAAEDAARLECFLFWDEETQQIDRQKARSFEFTGNAWEKAAHAFFQHFQDTAAYRALGKTLYITRDVEEQAAKARANWKRLDRRYVSLLRDFKDPSIIYRIVHDSIPVTMNMFGLFGKSMFSPKDFFGIRYVQAALAAYLCSDAPIHTQEKLMEQCVRYFDYKRTQTSESVQKGWVQQLFNAWVQAQADPQHLDDAKQLGDAKRRLDAIRAFQKEQQDHYKSVPALLEELSTTPETDEAVQAVSDAWEAYEEERQREIHEEVQRRIEEKRRRNAQRRLEEQRRERVEAPASPMPAAPAATAPAAADAAEEPAQVDKFSRFMILFFVVAGWMLVAFFGWILLYAANANTYEYNWIDIDILACGALCGLNILILLWRWHDK